MDARTEIRDGMRITWHQPIEMDDGIVLSADVYRPVGDGRYPVILSHGVYAKGLAYQDGYPMQWQKMIADHPEILDGSTNQYQAWEVTDPERWVPHGYAVVRVDSRGSGWSAIIFCHCIGYPSWYARPLAYTPCERITGYRPSPTGR